MVIRQATNNDLKGSLELASRVFGENMGSRFPLFYEPRNVENLFVAIDKGEIVSMIGLETADMIICGCRIKYAQMGSVCTYEEYRGRGLATKLLKMSYDYMDNRNIPLITISGGRGLYMRSGAVETGGKASYELSKDELSSIANTELNVKMHTNSFEIGSKTGNDLLKLYYNEPVRYVRDAEYFAASLSSMPMTGNKPTATTYIAYAGDEPIAYTIGYEDSEKPGLYRVVEFAGDRTVIPSLLKLIVEKHDKLSLNIQMHDSLTAVINDFCSPTTMSNTSGTIKIINKNKMINSIMPLIKEQSVEQSAAIVEKMNSLDEVALTHYLFDDYKRERSDTKPPVPLPCPGGLNYI